MKRSTANRSNIKESLHDLLAMNALEQKYLVCIKYVDEALIAIEEGNNLRCQELLQVAKNTWEKP